MSAAALVADLRARGVKLWHEAGFVAYRAPAGAITAADVEAIKALKPEIIALLTAPPRYFTAYARVLGERVLIAEDGEDPPNPERLPVYHRSELVYLLPLSDPEKRAIHRAKRAFGGIVPAPLGDRK